MLSTSKPTNTRSWSTGIRLSAAAFLFLAIVVHLFVSTTYALPPVPAVSPFDITGFLEEAAISDINVVKSGGTLKVNGLVVTVPKNTVVTMPATMLTWQELFTLAPTPYTGVATGMAMADTPRPLATHEVHVSGNRVGNNYIAGLVTFSQQSLNSGQGIINSIDRTTGELRIGGVMGDRTTGTRVRLNDPQGKYGRAYSPDVRFTVDTENPTVRSVTGYPMCIPRTVNDDPLCPSANRPGDPATGGLLTTFTMPPPGPGVFPDATKQVPFRRGDYVTFAGTLVQDGAATKGATQGPFPPNKTQGTYISAHTMVANLAIYTAPGVDPVYVAIDVTLLGTGGVTLAGATEASARTRFEGFTTDPTRVIDLFGIDVDCVTGGPHDGPRGSIDVDPGPPTGAVAGRWRFRPPSKVLSLPPGGVFLPPTREVRAVARGASRLVTANGLTSGQYHAPISEYIFPEQIIGNTPPPLNFETFPFLVDGSGPWPGGGPDPLPGPMIRQLLPWPGLTAPISSCNPRPGSPTVSAGTAQTVASGALVTLSGSGSDPNGLPLSFSWTQIAGPPVTLSNPTAVNTSFTAPILARASVPPAPPTAPAILTFRLAAFNGNAASVPSDVTIQVNPPAFAADQLVITTVTYRLAKQRLDVNANSTLQPNATLTLQGFGPMIWDPIVGSYSISAVGVPQPGSVTVTSNFGGTATSPILLVRP